MDLIGMILERIDWIQFLIYAAIVGIWEAFKLAIRKLAQIKPQVYIKFLIPVLGASFLVAADTIANRLNVESWYILLAGGGLLFVFVLPYAWRVKNAVIRWKEKRG